MVTTVGELASMGVKSISHEASVRDAAKAMRDMRLGSLLIEQGGQFVGIITDTDITRKVLAASSSPEEVKVSAVMSRPIITIERTCSPSDANDQMRDHGVRHLAVTDRGKIVGIFSVRDLLIYFQKASEPTIGID